MELTKKGRETRQRIIDTAKTMFARKGFAETGLRELAKHAEVNLAMSNYFFGSKKGLLKEILEPFYSGYLLLVQRQLIGPGKPEEKIRRFIHHAIAYIGANRDTAIIVLTELPRDDPEITRYKAGWAGKMMAIIKDEICTHPGQLLASTASVARPVTAGHRIQHADLHQERLGAIARRIAIPIEVGQKASCRHNTTNQLLPMKLLRQT